MILILSHDRDPHARAVAQRLEKLGETYLWFDCDRFPVNSEIHIGYEHDGLARLILRADGREYDLSALKAAWLRRLRVPRALPEIRNDMSRTWSAGVCNVALSRMWELVRCRWMPGLPADEDYANNKVLQLALAARLGWRVPRTVVTNSPDDFLAFYEQCDGRMVTKLANGAGAKAQVFVGLLFPAHTQVVRRRDLMDFRSIRFAPMMLQEYVPKRVELRITVVGSQVFAAEIDSQSNPRSRDDWRAHDLDREMYRPYALPADVEALCVRLVRELHLCYGAFDVVVTPAGEYVFLEVNPNGQWLWIEDRTGLPIADAIARYLAYGESDDNGSNDHQHSRQLDVGSEPAFAF